jgi:hypothetical protein
LKLYKQEGDFRQRCIDNQISVNYAYCSKVANVAIWLFIVHEATATTPFAGGANSTEARVVDIDIWRMVRLIQNMRMVRNFIFWLTLHVSSSTVVRITQRQQQQIKNKNKNKKS